MTPSESPFKTLTLPGATLAVQHEGAGKALVFLHAGVADKRMWQSQLDRFKASHQVIAYDRRGFGETQAEDVPFSQVEDLEAVLRALELDNVTLIGCSQGGRTAIDFALSHPEKVNALILIASAVSGAPSPQSFAPEVQVKLDALAVSEEADDLGRVNELEAQLWLDGPRSPAGRVSGAVRDLFLDMNAVALRHPELTRERGSALAYERVAELNVPTLIVWGELDFEHIKERCHYLLANIPDAQGEEIQGVAHLPSLESERVNELISAFVD